VGTAVMLSWKKVITWLVVAFVVFYLIRSPERSAELVKTAGAALGSAASSLAAFVARLV
jgi:Sec-independent protein translocase protein TatA